MGRNSVQQCSGGQRSLRAMRADEKKFSNQTIQKRLGQYGLGRIGQKG